MPLLKPLLLLLFLLPLSHTAQAAYSDPVGIWDMTGKASLRAKFSGLSLPARRMDLVDTVQFHEDGRFSAFLVSNVDGHWRAGKKSNYRVTYNASQINDAATPDLFNYMANQFYELTDKTFGTAFFIQDIRIKSYRDSGTLKKRGMAIKGLVRVRANIDFIVPTGKKTAKAQVDFTIRYTAERASAPSACCISDDPAQNLADSRAFLDENALLPRVQKTTSGLQYRVIEEGTGASPAASDTVTVNYRGTLPSGIQFDANSNISFPLDRVIAGWTEGLQLMREGAYYRFYIPPELAYGEFGSGGLIKPNTALIFDVQLVKVGG